MHKVLVITGSFALLLGGCGDSRASSDAEDGRRSFGATDVHLLGTSGSLSTIADLDVLPDGRVWALNSIEPFFVGFGADGAAPRAHGREGGGPEEFTRPVGLVTGGIGGEAWVLDAGRHALVRISTPDAARAEIHLNPDSIPRGALVGGRDVSLVRVRTARMGDLVIVPRSTISRAGGWTSVWVGFWAADLMGLSPEDGSAAPVVRLIDALGDPSGHAPPTPDWLPFPPWFRLWAVCGDAELRVHDRLRNQIRGFRMDGAELRSHELPEPRLASVSEEAFARALIDIAAMEVAGSVGLDPPPVDSARLLPLLRARIDEDGAHLAELLPRYVDLHCTESGVVWVRPFDVERGGLRGGPRWLRITPDGAVQDVVLPERFDPLRFTDGRIWGAFRDQHDVASVAWIAW